MTSLASRKQRKKNIEAAKAETSEDSVPKRNGKIMLFEVQTSNTKGKYASFATMKEHIIGRIKKELLRGVDVAESLEDDKLLDLPNMAPKRLYSDNPDPKLQAREDEEYRDLHSKQSDRHIDRLDLFDENLRISYTMIMDSCTNAMKERVLTDPDHKAFKTDPVKLLNAIKQATHAPTRAVYPYGSLVEALIRWLSVKQRDDEDILEFVKRVKQLGDVVKTMLGPAEFLKHFVHTTKEYLKADATEKIKLEKGAWKQLCAYVCLKGSDQNKYGSVLKGFVSQYSLNNCQYPKTCDEVTDVLSNHTFDPKYAQVQKEKKEQKKKKDKKNKDSALSTSFAQKESVCYCCGKAGHTSKTCRNKNKISAEKWHVHKVMTNHQSAKTSGNSENTGNTKSAAKSDDEGWSGFQQCHDVGFTANQNSGDKFEFLKESFILDTGSTIGATVMNPKFVKNIRESENTVLMSTNAGTKEMKMDGDIAGFGTAKYDPDQMANIFGFLHMVDQYRITYDSEKEDAFVVHQAWPKTIRTS